MEIDAGWAGVTALVGGFFGYLSRHEGAYKDQLQIALASVEAANARVEKLEGKIAGQAREIEILRRQVLELESTRDRLEHRVEDMEATKTSNRETIKAMAAQLEILGMPAAPAAPPLSPTHQRRKR